jgi:serine/threonine-protein kinase RsbW
LNKRLFLTLHSSLAEVQRLGEEFGHFADRNHLRAEVRFAVNLALEEIVTNIITHGYRGRADQSISVEVIVGPDEVRARIEDSAQAFDPLQLPPPDISAPLAQRQVGGLGVHLSKKLLDGLEYSRMDGKNRLDFHKKL